MPNARIHILADAALLAAVAAVQACARSPTAPAPRDPVPLPLLLYGDFGACAYCAPAGETCAPLVIDCPADVATGRVAAFDRHRPPGKEAWVRLREYLNVGETCTFVPDQYCPQWGTANGRAPPCDAPPPVRVSCTPIAAGATAAVAWQWDALSRFFGGPVADLSATSSEPAPAGVQEGAAFAAYATGVPVRIPAGVLPRAGGRCMQYPEFYCLPVTIVSVPYSIERFCPLPDGIPAPCPGATRNAAEPAATAPQPASVTETSGGG